MSISDDLRSLLPAYLDMPIATAAISQAADEIERLTAQLPEGMKHCTIVFKECEKGHGRLTAANWVEHGCLACEIERLMSVVAQVNAKCDHLGIRLGEVIKERDTHQKAAAWCDKHKPNGGARSQCVICTGGKLSATLSRISYLCGEPNEMECSTYDVFLDEDAVVAMVQALTKERDALRLDAERYRWLRANHLQVGPDAWIRTGADLEEAIDTAMKEKP